jgi:hypothetical protein
VNDGVVERNSIGEAAYEALQQAQLPITGFETTSKTKPPLIHNLQHTLETEEFQFIANDVWTGELEAYEQKVDYLGRSKFSAPDGMNDDTVIARALMAHGATKPRWLIY